MMPTMFKLLVITGASDKENDAWNVAPFAPPTDACN
jgi:hypothetical protein